MKKRVTGIGGIFFKSENPEKLRAWYRKHLGIESETWGAVFFWKNEDDKAEDKPYTAWSAFKEDTQYLNPSTKPFMINYRVENLKELLIELEKEGVEILPEKDSSEYGDFAWIMDLEGNKIELWQPPVGS